MLCPLCQKFYEKYPLVPDEDKPGELKHVFEINEDGSPGLSSDPIRCAFENEVFSTDNWCCHTMWYLREVFHSKMRKKVWHNDSNVGVLPIPITHEEGIQQGMLVMSWYKNR